MAGIQQHVGLRNTYAPESRNDIDIKAADLSVPGHTGLVTEGSSDGVFHGR